MGTIYRPLNAIHLRDNLIGGLGNENKNKNKHGNGSSAK
jgi:hypothetical protein